MGIVRLRILFLCGLLTLATAVTGCFPSRMTLMEKKRMEIIAHRGASHDASENTLAAINLGWQRNADGVEIDIHLSKDRQIVVMHDSNTKSTAGLDKNIAEQTLAELRTLDAGSWKGTSWASQKIPTLAEALATIPNGKQMFVEIKCGPDIVPELRQVVAESKKASGQIAFISFSPEVCAEVKNKMPQHHVYWLAGFSEDEKNKSMRPTVDELIEKSKKAKIDGLDLACNGPIDRDFVAKVKANGLGVYVWTVDDPAVAKRMVAAGADGITTNRPAFLRESLNK